MKLNLGCGDDIRDGYINIDALPNLGVDMVFDITQKLPFKTNSCDEIIAQDILEHLTREQLQFTLSEISRVLIIGGIVKIRIPNVDAIIEKFSDDPETRNLFIYGDSHKTGIWGVHKAGYTPKTFISLCRYNGLILLKGDPFQGSERGPLSDTNFEFEFKKSNSEIKLKKILFINQTLGIGGAETFNTSLLNWFKTKNLIIKSYTNNDRFNQMLGDSQKIPVVLDIVGNWKGLFKALILWPYGLLIYINIFLKNRDCDVILMTGFMEKIIITPLAKLFNKPVIWIEFGPMETLFNRFFGFPKFLYRLVSQLPDFVIMPTVNTYKHNVAICHIPTAKIKIIPCAIEKPKSVKYNPQKNLVVCVSRLEKGKGQDLLIASWPKVLEKFPDAKLRIIGEGDFKLKSGKNIVMTGWVKNVWDELEKASVLVFPSVWPLEGFGLVMIEAMSLGIPVVAFNHAPANEIIDNNSGVLVTDLSDGIISMLQKPVTGGIKRFNENYTFDIIGSKYLEIFKQAVCL